MCLRPFLCYLKILYETQNKQVALSRYKNINILRQDLKWKHCDLSKTMWKAYDLNHKLTKFSNQIICFFFLSDNALQNFNCPFLSFFLYFKAIKCSHSSQQMLSIVFKSKERNQSSHIYNCRSAHVSI